MKEKKVCGNCKKEFLSSDDFLECTSNWRLSDDERLWFNCDCGSTMCLPKGGYPWYSPSLKLSAEAKSIFNQIPKLETLPNIPATIIEIQNALMSEEFDVDEIVKLVKIEPFTLTEVLYVFDNLRVSKKERRPREVSVRHAVAYIGKKRLSSIILRSMFKKLSFKTKVFPLDTFWQTSLITGLISEQLWMLFKSEFDRDRAFVSGYLCNIGKMAGVIVFPEKMDDLWTKLQDVNLQDTWVNLERNVPLMDHCLLGEIAAAFWGFPDFTFNPIKYHHNPKARSKEADGFLCHVVALANYLTHWIMLEPHLIDAHGIKQCESYFKLSSEELEGIVTQLQKQLYLSVSD